jgi:hypothetical protein
MTSWRKRCDVDYLAHREVAGMVRMKVVPRQLGESAIGQERCLHVSSRWIKRSRVKIFHSIKETGRANEGVDCLPTGVVPDGEKAIDQRLTPPVLRPGRPPPTASLPRAPSSF